MTVRRNVRVEWPTLAVAAAIYGGFAALTLAHHDLPAWLVAIAGGVLIAWHGSLQHECVHGHPTRSSALNAALVWPSLWLWLPYESYRRSHLRHHRTDALTEPSADPESNFVTADRWNRAGPLWRAFLAAHQTLAGRLILGPFAAVLAAWRDELGALARGHRATMISWVIHLPACAAVLAWTSLVCDIPLGEYLALYVYPGISLTLLRSFAEHQPNASPLARTAVVESGPLLSLLYLNNNLHVAHHREPGLSWYRLPARWREMRADAIETGTVTLFGGYAEIARRFGLRGAHSPVHPLT